jgi:hypothetical protein
MLSDIDAALARLPKAKQIPQTPKYLQHVMAADAEIMLKMDKRIRFLEDQLRRKEAKAMKWKSRYYKLKLQTDILTQDYVRHTNTIEELKREPEIWQNKVKELMEQTS